jgi:ABC-type Mn2+/Zn2+ transport system permease subunit
VILPLDTLIYSLITGVFVGLAAGYLGSLMVLEKMALVGDALSHVALPGLALGIVFNFNPFIGAFAFLFVSAVVIWQLRRMTRLPFDTIVGAIFTLALAIGITILPDYESLVEALFGNITAVTYLYAIAGVVCSIVAVFLTKVIYKKLVLGMISEDLATSKGISIARINLLYLLLVSLVVAFGITIVGTLLVGFLVIVPAAAAKNLSSNLTRYAILSSFFGAVSVCVGIMVSNALNLQTISVGPLVVFSGIAIFVVTVVMKWRTK